MGDKNTPNAGGWWFLWVNSIDEWKPVHVFQRLSGSFSISGTNTDVKKEGLKWGGPVTLPDWRPE